LVSKDNPNGPHHQAFYRSKKKRSVEKKIMKNTLMVGLILILLAGTTLAWSTSRLAKPSSDAPATSTIADIDQSTGAIYRVGSDSLGQYRNGVNSVSSIVQGIGNWVLDTKPSALRKVRIDLGDPVVGSGPNPPFQAAVVPVRFISKCTTSIFTLSLNQSVQCPLAISMEYNGITYALRSEPNNYVGTQPVTWTCRARNSTKCVSWRMFPSVVQADGQSKVIMQLLIPANSPRGAEVLRGRFYMSFDVGVTTP
jgi:hypothetical protein